MADDAPVALSPYARARQLQDQAIPADQIQKTLVAEGVDPNSAQVVIRALRGAAADDFGPPAPLPTSTAAAVPPVHPCPRHADFPVTESCTRCGKFFCAKCVQAAHLENADEPSTRCPECRRLYPEVQGLGGWLLLPALHLVLVPVSTSMALYKDLHLLSGPVAKGYVIPIAIEAAANFARLVFTVVVALSFFQKKQRAVRLCIAFYAVNIVYALFEVCIVLWIRDLSGKSGDSTGPVTALVNAVFAAVWIAYFMHSKRVRATFIVG